MVCPHHSSHTKPAGVTVGHQDGGAWPGGLLLQCPPCWGGEHDGLGKVSAALAAPRTGPGRRVLGSIGGGEECSWRGMELCRSFCWTWTQPRDGSPVPATLPHGQQSERLPEPLVMPLLHGLQQRTVVGGRFPPPRGAVCPQGASPARTGELSSTHLLQRWTPESSR